MVQDPPWKDDAKEIQAEVPTANPCYKNQCIDGMER